MTKVTIYHNPRCSKSRKALQLLQEKGCDVTAVQYLKTPPSKQDIKNILMMLDLCATDLVRKSEGLYKTLNLQAATGALLIQAMAENPVLIERPIVIAKGKAVIARPPETALSIV
jgi:arsenate reductase (glutaredoxin)